MTLFLVPSCKWALIPMGSQDLMSYLSSLGRPLTSSTFLFLGSDRGAQLKKKEHLITVSQMNFPQIHSIWCLSLRDTCKFLRVSYN